MFCNFPNNNYKFNSWFSNVSSLDQSGKLVFGNNSFAFLIASFLYLLFIFKYSSVVSIEECPSKFFI